MAISGDTAVVGADWWEGSSGSNIGAAYGLERNEDGLDSWGQVTRLLAADGASGDFFRHSVSISGDTIVVGAWGENGAGTDRGAAYVFTLQPYKNYLPLVVNNNEDFRERCTCLEE